MLILIIIVILFMKKKKKFISNIDLLNQKISIFNDLEKINNKYCSFDEKTNSWFDIKKNLLINYIS